MPQVVARSRASIFIDGSNFFKYCEELHIYSYQIEWDKFLLDLVQDREIVTARYYDCPKREEEVPDQARRQKQFFSHLRKIDWMQLVFGRLEPRGRPPNRHLVEKAVDVHLAVDMILGAVRDEYDHAFLISADGDYTPAIEAVQELGKRVLVATPGKSNALKASANAFIRLEPGRISSFLRPHGGP